MIVARSGFDGRGRVSYFGSMIKRSFSTRGTILVAILAGLAQVSAAKARSPGQSPLPDLDWGGAPRQAKPETQQPPASPPATRTPRLSPQPTDPTPPDPQAKADEDGKEQVAALPPDSPSQRRRALDDLYAYLAATENARTSVPLVAAIERLWLFSGSDTIDVLMERVLKAVAEQRLELAAKLADTIVTLEPGFAEGWNRRALVAYLQGDQQNALDALSRALALEPSHFKALDGMAQIMRERGDKAAALKAYRKLLDVHPYWEGAQEAMEQLTREVEGDGI
jgi:tetratricopeptide (TPR) repeat protein